MKEEERLIESLHPLERTVLPILKDHLSVQDIQKLTKLQEVEVVRALQWLENKKILHISRNTKEIVSLDDNGKKYREEGLPEHRFLKVLEHPLSIKEIQQRANLDNNELTIALGLLKKRNLITIKDKITRTPEAETLITQEFPELELLAKLPVDIAKLSPHEKQLYEELKHRKRIIRTDIRKIKTINLTDLGKKLLTVDLKREYIEALTPSILNSTIWKTKPFRRYDVIINVPQITPAKRHFVNQAIGYVRRIWLDMGFKEMTGPLLDTTFWNFDALFVPQDHPARELQDTFYVQGQGTLPSQELTKKIKQAHEAGTPKSRGWQYRWDQKKATDLVLRTQTTSLSARTLAQLTKKDLPAKYFAIGRVFRNEALDWSHLFEFDQTEGIVVDENVDFTHLLGYLKEFFKKMGFEKIRFRPGFFPYTYNSVEVEVYNTSRKKWIELGGAGIFRPEVVKPLLGKEIPVLAWGLGLGRIIMDYCEIQDLRDLYKNDLNQLKTMKVWMK